LLICLIRGSSLKPRRLAIANPISEWPWEAHALVRPLDAQVMLADLAILGQSGQGLQGDPVLGGQASAFARAASHSPGIRDQALEVAREAGAVAGERDALHEHAMRGATQPPEPGAIRRS
jgi:hypothetical protein